MNSFIRILSVGLLLFFAGLELEAQCVPDTVNCIDTGNPGQICPRNLPEVTVNVAYDESITVIAPDTVEQFQLDIVYIVVDSVNNLPPGISYTINADKFYPDSIYCIRVFGTTTEAGEYPLSIVVTPYIYYALIDDTIAVEPPIRDDTSVVMVVSEPSGIDPNRSYEFRIIPNTPNPFSRVTRLGFYTPFDDRVELKVFNILGELMYEESQGATPGEHFFRFDGEELIPGTYFYRVTNSQKLVTGKFIKSR